MTNSFEVTNLIKQYNGFTLGPVNLVLPQGCIMGLVGENGAGKTTLIKLLLGLIRKDAGRVCLLGQEDGSQNPAIKEDVGVVFDESSFPVSCRGKDVDTILKHIYKQWDSTLYWQYLDRLQLPANKPIKDFSRGMKMKLQIAAALAHRPRLLLLDEPTGGLDPIVRDEILDVFLAFIEDEQHSILLSSHITGDLEKIADYIAFIHRGTIRLCEPKDELLERYGVLKCTAAQFEQLDKELIHGFRKNQFGVEVLVDREKMPRGAVIDPVRIDDIMLFLTKGAE